MEIANVKMAQLEATYQDGLSTRSTSPEPQFDTDETPLTQVAINVAHLKEIQETEPFVILKGISDASFSAKIPFKPGGQAITVGRSPACTTVLPDDREERVSRQHFVIIGLGSGLYVVCVGQNGMAVIRDAQRIECPVFPHKAPFKAEILPTKKDMVKIEVGDILQLGRGDSTLGALGEAIFSEYKHAEYEIVHGDGVCGTGEHCRKKKEKRSHDDSENDASPRKPGMMQSHESKSRRRKARIEGQARRFSEVQRSMAQSAKPALKYGNKGPNTKANTTNKREMKNMLQQVFSVWNHNAKGKGKGKGTFGKGKGKGTFGKRGLGKGKGKGKGEGI